MYPTKKKLECRSAAADTRIWGQNTSSSIINWVGNYHQLCGGGFVNSLGVLAENQPLFRAVVASKGGHQCSVFSLMKKFLGLVLVIFPLTQLDAYISISIS